MNEIEVQEVIISEYRIDYKYDVRGEWAKFFDLENSFYVEYEEKILGIPESIAVIPLLANLMPVSWLMNGTVILKTLDSKFYRNLPIIKENLGKIHNQKFGGKVVCEQEENVQWKAEKTALLFSGGVDSVSTLISRYDEKPLLISVWGADIDDRNLEGWHNAKKNSEEISKQMEMDITFVKASLRRFLKEPLVSKLCRDVTSESYWFAMQHNIGVIGLIAPLAYVKDIKTLYFASTHSAKYGNQHCASDPQTDNYISYGSESTVHEGYE